MSPTANPSLFVTRELAPPVPPATLPASASRLLAALLSLRHSGPAEPAERAARLSELCRWVCELHGVEIELEGALPSEPCIIVANHLGYIDPVVLCSLIQCSPIAKAEIANWPLLGPALRSLNVSFVRRGDPASGARVLLRSLRALAAGVSVLNFPEGTTRRGGLGSFHLGAFWLARRSGLPILPIGMDFEDPALCWVDDEGFLPHYAKLWWSQRRWRVRLSVGQPLEPSAFRSELDLAWAARTRIGLLRQPYASSQPLAG